MGIETICEAGAGGSATVYIQLRDEFPGLGGKIKTKRDVVCACRVPSGLDPDEITETKNNITVLDLEDAKLRKSINLFLRHTLIKKFDDYFFRKGHYNFSHVPRPLGSNGDGVYFYEWVPGEEGFSPKVFDKDFQDFVPVLVDEWKEASGCFNNAGIGIFDDIVDNDGEYIKNLILLEPRAFHSDDYLSKLWKRIDFGPESLKINYDRLFSFIKDNKDSLEQYLRPERFDMINLILEFLSNPLKQYKYPCFDELISLVKDYRFSTLEHMGLEEFIDNSQFNKSLSQPITYSESRKMKDFVFRKQLKSDRDSNVDIEIRSGFKSIDGIIYTLQEFPVARVTCNKENSFHSGFELFARHFILRKLEDMFISMGKYHYSHIPRPLGSYGDSYYYEWIYGFENCPKNLLENHSSTGKGLDDWSEFFDSFNEAGIDMKFKMGYYKKNNENTYYAKQIIVQQPSSPLTKEHISRFWKRVSFDQDTTPFDYDKLIKYFEHNEEYIRHYLKKGRYETLFLLVKYLKKEDMSDSEFQDIKKGIHDYRISTLRHLNHKGFSYPPDGLTDLFTI